jgi:hypothetical protein
MVNQLCGPGKPERGSGWAAVAWQNSQVADMIVDFENRGLLGQSCSSRGLVCGPMSVPPPMVSQMRSISGLIASNQVGIKNHDHSNLDGDLSSTALGDAAKSRWVVMNWAWWPGCRMLMVLLCGKLE